jgi:molybdate transport system substrate-binding protein
MIRPFVAGHATTRRRKAKPWRTLAGCGALALLAGCAGGTADRPTTAGGTAGGTNTPTASGALTVFAASSLTDVFTELGDQLMAEHPDLTVTFSFAASSTLVTQVQDGAPADLLATADAPTMEKVGDAALDPVVFAYNELVLVTTTPQVTELADLANPDVRVAVCDVAVPCGAAAERVLTAAGVTASVATYGDNVKNTLAYVTSGDADAALVYATDARAAGDAVTTITIPGVEAERNDDVVTVLTGTSNPAAAQAFIDLLLSPAGRDALATAGFTLP